jgi:hypothetical protein
MDNAERTALIYRIISGYTTHDVLGVSYRIYTPSIEILLRASSVYREVLESHKYNEWVTDLDCEKILIYNGLWDREFNVKLENLTKSISDCKHSIFKDFFNYPVRMGHKNRLQSFTEQYLELENIRHSLDYFTLVGFAQLVQSQFIISETTYSMEGDRIFPSFNSANFSLLNILQSKVNENTLSISTLREIVKNEPWISMWKASKTDVFPQKGVLLSSEQRNLIIYSQLYDRVGEHSECPADEIINDDDALDGWMIEQHRKRASEQGEKVVKSNKMDNAQEIFLPANSKEDIERIEGFNTFESKMIKAQRNAIIKKVGAIEDAKLPDQQLRIRQMVNEQARR